MLAISFAAFLASVEAQLVTGVDDVTYWIGSGTNQSVLAIDFQDGESKQAFAWGYRFNETPSGARMLLDVAAADPNLNLAYTGDADAALYLTEISYFDGTTLHTQQNGDFFTDSRYWGYFVAGGTAGGSFTPLTLDLVVPGPSALLPASWLESPSGPSAESYGIPGRFLGHLSWDMWAFGEYGTTPTATVYAAAAVPEPSSWALLTLSAALLLFFGLRHARR